MLVLYGNYSVSWALGGTGSPAPSAPNGLAGLSSGRSGAGSSFVWGGGAQTTGSYVQLTGTITDPLDATAPIGCVGVVNVQGLPVGTLVDIQAGAYTQRLVAGRRGELSAWIPPTAFVNSNTLTLRIYNNVNGSPTIAALTPFYIGQVIVGRLMSWPLLVATSPPQEEIVDPTQYQRSSGGQLWQLMRKPYSQITAKMGGALLTTDAVGGSLSLITSGANPAGTIDARTLLYSLATTPVCAVCAFPHKGPGNVPVTKTAGGFPFDATMLNLNFMLARPTLLQPIAMESAPRWSWAAQFQEAI